MIAGATTKATAHEDAVLIYTLCAICLSETGCFKNIADKPFDGDKLMDVECTTCKTRYRIKDDLLSIEKVVKFSCKACKSTILVDLKKCMNENAQQHIDPSSSLKTKILKSIKDLPLIPKVVADIQSELFRTDVDSKRVAAMIETDPGITSKVLRIANSSYYGASGKISTILQASIVLGLRGLSEILIMAGTEKVLSGKLPGYGYDSGQLWAHSLAVAYGAKILADTRDAGISSAAHIAGLIHDIGRIILDPYVEELKSQIVDYMQKNQITFLDAEVQFFGFSHAEVASEVCRAWKYPEFISKAINWHHNPVASNGDLLSHILHMADNLAAMSGAGYDDDDILNEIQKETMSFLRITQVDLSEILFKITESVNNIGIS